MNLETTAPARTVDKGAVLAAAVTVLLWASAFVGIRGAVDSYSPGALALGRLLSASVILAAVLLVRREGFPKPAAWPGILASGVLWFGGYMVVLNFAEREVDAGTAAMLVNIGPILIALVGGWLLKEGFPPRLMAGMAVSFAGAVVVGLSMSGGGGATIVGVLLCLVSAMLYATGVVTQKPVLKHATPLQATAYGCFVGTAALLPFGPRLVGEVGGAPLPATLSMVYLGVFPTALAFTTWAYALARTTAGKMGATTYIVPAIVVVMSWAVLREVPGWLTFAGGALCLAGVAVSRTRPRRRLAAAA